MSNLDTNVMMGDKEISLADLAGVDMSEVQEYRLTVAPAGKYYWRIINSKIDSIETQKSKDEPDVRVKKPVIQFELEAQTCFALIDDKLDPANFVGQKHKETFWISDLAKDLGRVKAFLVDIGIESVGTLADLIAESHGMEFVSDVTNNPNKDNPDFIYANLKNIISMEEFQESQSEMESETEAVA